MYRVCALNSEEALPKKIISSDVICNSVDDRVVVESVNLQISGRCEVSLCAVK